MSNWINHVREYATRKGITYNLALKDPETKATYHAKKAESKAVDTGNKIFRKKRETNKLLNFNEETISVPRELAMDDKVVPTLTKSNSISKRKGKPSIILEPNDENKINIITENKPHDEKFDEFKTELKTRRKGRQLLKGMNTENIVI
jgi:hypothetical protein